MRGERQIRVFVEPTQAIPPLNVDPWWGKTMSDFLAYTPGLIEQAVGQAIEDAPEIGELLSQETTAVAFAPRVDEKRKVHFDIGVFSFADVTAPPSQKPVLITIYS